MARSSGPSMYLSPLSARALAHVVDVEAQLALLQARAADRLLLLALLARLRDLGRVEPRHDHHPVVVGDDRRRPAGRSRRRRRPAR